jgi:hypothetical protein
MYKMHHPKADTYRLHVKRKGGGRGLLLIEVAYEAKIINTVVYLNTKCREDQLVNIIKSHESNEPNMKSIIKLAAKFAEELNQSNENSETN